MDADYLVVGAGCAGLSLAVHLAARGLRGRRLTVVDPRTAFPRDRTWCFWDVHDHPFRDAVTHRWACWRVTAAGADVVCGPGRYCYQHLAADAFYAAALSRLRATPGVEVRLGEAVHAVRDAGDHVDVRTSRGVLRAGAVFDSRPVAAQARAGEVSLHQQFVGAFVRADHAAFDPTTVTLMHFGPAGAWDGRAAAGAVWFAYVLPFGAREALVEATAITPVPLDDAALERSARDYLAAQHPGVSFEAVRTERGSLPMSTAPVTRRPSPRVYRIGVAGGLAKPSTGYAFLAIQRDAAELARRVLDTPGVAGALPAAPRPRGARATFLDRVFLSYLRRHPQRAPDVFTRLFARTPAEVLVRFLSDVGTLADQVRVIAALPVRPFAGEAARSARLWLRA